MRYRIWVAGQFAKHLVYLPLNIEQDVLTQTLGRFQLPYRHLFGDGEQCFWMLLNNLLHLLVGQQHNGCPASGLDSRRVNSLWLRLEVAGLTHEIASEEIVMSDDLVFSDREENGHRSFDNNAKMLGIGARREDGRLIREGLGLSSLNEGPQPLVGGKSGEQGPWNVGNSVHRYPLRPVRGLLCALSIIAILLVYACLIRIIGGLLLPAIENPVAD